MSLPIENKVAQSGLISIDLSDFIANNEIMMFDIKPFLFMELILKEKDFRSALAEFDFSIYTKKVVGVYCSTDAIIPMWANMLVASALNPFATKVYFGNEEQVREQLIMESIQHLDASDYTDQRVVVKGCGETPITASAYIAITQKLRPVVKSIMYGEPCSTVPVFKRKD